MKNEKKTSTKKKLEKPVDKEAENLTDTIVEVLDEISEEKKPKASEKGVHVTVIDNEKLLIEDREYLLVKNHRDAFQAEKLGERYSNILGRYDYIVADWGYDQLRLKGFFSSENRKVPVDQRIDSLEDYLYEFCNFGCAYFVIERIGGRKEKPQNRSKRKKQTQKTVAHVEEKQGSIVSKPKKSPVIKNKKDSIEKKQLEKKNKVKIEQKKTSKEDTLDEKRHFTIRKKEE